MGIRGEYWSTEKEGLAMCKKEKALHPDEELCS